MTFKFSTNLSGGELLKPDLDKIPLVFTIIRDYLSFRQDLETNRLLFGVATKRRYDCSLFHTVWNKMIYI
jgi:hypothetical protein